MAQLKEHSKQYRNIKGVRYICWSADSGENWDFAECKQEAKEKGLKYRIIEDQFYIEEHGIYIQVNQ